MNTVEDFEAQVGTAFDVAYNGEKLIALELKEVSRKAALAEDRVSFSAVFVGPVGEDLGQGLYSLSTASVEAEIFLVPIGPFEGGMGYEAVFN